MTTLGAVLHPARAFATAALGRNVALALLLGTLLFLTAYPMAMLVYGSLHTTPPGEAGTFNLDGYRAMLSRANAVVLLNTIGLPLCNRVQISRKQLRYLRSAGAGPSRLSLGRRRHGYGSETSHYRSRNQGIRSRWSSSLPVPWNSSARIKGASVGEPPGAGQSRRT